MPPAELVDPVAYAGWWPWVALGIVVAVLAWYVWVLRSTRAPADAATPAPAAEARPVPTSWRDPYAALRATATARLDEVERRYRDGEVDVRGANLEIRYALREFATGRTGVDTSAMTAATARADHRTRRLASLLENSSVPTFAATSRTRLTRTLEQARKLVSTW